MPIPRRFELDDLVNRPGTYFNPQTEVLIVVDDSTDVDSEIFEATDAEETEWVLIADDVPVDETARDDLIERFQNRHHPGVSGAIAADEDDVDELDDITPDADEDDDEGYDEEDEEDELDGVEEL
jgi:GT2 family glycosyltransferase